jgi:iron complex outermembrane receptor protein
MRTLFLTLLCFFSTMMIHAQGMSIVVSDEQEAALSNATVELWRSSDSMLVKAQVSDSSGKAVFGDLKQGSYYFRISRIGFLTRTTIPFQFSNDAQAHHVVRLTPTGGKLSTIRVEAQKPFIELKADKTVVHPEAWISNAGATAMEALEKMPGVTIDKDGNISLKGKQGVLVMIDGKPTYLGAAELSSYLSGMSASQISEVELMDQPPAGYDAAGNAGIINIRLKKNRQSGFNGSISLSAGHGRYPKTNDAVQLNYREGRVNVFLNYSFNYNRYLTSIYALRTYYAPDDHTVTGILEQPSEISGDAFTHSLRTGIDYTLNKKTTLGLTWTGNYLIRGSDGNNPALWKNAQGVTDSVVLTGSHNNTDWKSGGVNLNLRHEFSPGREITADLDALGYRMRTDQLFENVRSGPSGYAEASKGEIPASIGILSAKADYHAQLKKNTRFDAGWKSSAIHTDNLAAYYFAGGGNWIDDLGKSNHFLYDESLHALYGSINQVAGRWTMQGGLRYESTHYDAEQLGNAVNKDSSFSRSYNSLFPSAMVSFQADSSNGFSFSAGRRIDRPAFQKLNPFLFIINKYTYQQGNPYFRPQYTWNMQVSHAYREKIITTLSYSITNDYFSQIFLADAAGIITYTEGNLGKLHNLGLSVSMQLSPARWWSFSGQGSVNHKEFDGMVTRFYQASVTQASFSLNNQFRFGKGWAAELSGFYLSGSQQDLQEVLEPSGQLSAGLSRSLWKNKGTLRLAMRDIFHTQWMKGLTQFNHATEYFLLTRDTRVVNVSFSYRFGKASKSQRRSEGAATEEAQRAGSGG